MNIDINGKLKGTYVLLVAMPRTCRIRVGGLAEMEFPMGFYAYVGSAMAGLQARLSRHLRRSKRVRWHVDYLLREGIVRGVIYASTQERLECELARRLEEVFRSFPGFGSSDCRCPSHLFFSEEVRALRQEAEGILRSLVKRGKSVNEVVQEPLCISKLCCHHVMASPPEKTQRKRGLLYSQRKIQASWDCCVRKLRR